MFDADSRVAFERGPQTTDEWLAFIQRVNSTAHRNAIPADGETQQAFRLQRRFDPTVRFLGPDGLLYERDTDAAENPGWMMRRKVLGLGDPQQKEFDLGNFIDEMFDFGALAQQPSVTTSGGTPTPQKTPRGTPLPPSLTLDAERRKSILDDTPASFPIKYNPNADGSEPWYTEHRIGSDAVAKTDKLIEEEANRLGLDPDLLRAVIYVENSQGHYGGLAGLVEKLGMAKTVFPMNINPALWSGVIGVRPEDLSDPQLNIRAGATLLKRIKSRLSDPSIAKIASIYNFGGAEQVSDYGTRVEEAYYGKRRK